MWNSPLWLVWCVPLMVKFFSKSTWIGDSGASCHITNDDKDMYDVIGIDELIQGSSGIMPTMKKGKLQVTVCQVSGEEQVHTLWFVKFCPFAGANLFSLMCKLLQGDKISSYKFNNIIINTPNGNIIFDCWIKTCNGWVAGVDFLWASIDNRALSATALPKQNVNNLHIELGHPSEAITISIAKALGIQVTGTFSPSNKQSEKRLYLACKFWGKGFSLISAPYLLHLGGKCHWLLVIDNCSNYCWHFFLPEKSDLAQTMLALVNN